MMDEASSEKSIAGSGKSDKGKSTTAILITMILLGTVFVAFLAYQYLGATQTNVPVLVVDVFVGQVGDDVFIQTIEYRKSEMIILDSPRTDDDTLIPGVRVRINRDQDILSYDTFVEYDAEGNYKLTCGFRELPEEGDLLECNVWVYSGRFGSFADDQESIQVIWGMEKVNNVIKAKVSVQSSLPNIGSDAEITSVEITAEQRDETINSKIFYPGVYGHANKFNHQASYIAVEKFEGPFNYTLFIGLLEEPNEGDEFTVVIKVWPRNGQWDEGYYQQPADSYSTTFVWG